MTTTPLDYGGTYHEDGRRWVLVVPHGLNGWRTITDGLEERGHGTADLARVWADGHLMRQRPAPQTQPPVSALYAEAAD